MIRCDLLTGGFQRGGLCSHPTIRATRVIAVRCGEGVPFVPKCPIRGSRHPHDPEALRELVEELQSSATPTLVVGGRVIVGFDPQAYEAALAPAVE